MRIRLTGFRIWQSRDSVITATDLVRQHGGWTMTSTASPRPPITCTIAGTCGLGGSLYRFEGLRFGELTWAQLLGNVPRRIATTRTARKNDRNMFLKAHYTLGPGLYLMGDLQFRTVDYTFEGPDRMGNRLPQTVNFNFFNPKAGITYRWNARHRVYFSFCAREGNRCATTSSILHRRVARMQTHDRL